MRARGLVQVIGSFLVALTLASLLALSVAQAHCSQIQALVQHGAAHAAHHHHGAEDPTLPQQGHSDHCCGVLCTAAACLVSPQHPSVAAVGSAYIEGPFRSAYATLRLAKRAVLPVGSRAPPL